MLISAWRMAHGVKFSFPKLFFVIPKCYKENTSETYKRSRHFNLNFKMFNVHIQEYLALHIVFRSHYPFINGSFSGSCNRMVG